MADQQIVFNVGVKLEAVQSSVNELKKILDNLQPNSKGFKDLDRVVSALSKTMGDLQQRSAKGFVNESQINQAAKLIEKMESQLEGAQQVVNGLKFGDLQLTDAQLKTFADLRAQLDEINRQYAAVKEQFKQSLLSDQNTKNFMSGTMSMANDLDKDFDTIAAKVEKKAADLRQAAEKARQQADLYASKALTAEAVGGVFGTNKNGQVKRADPLQALAKTDQFSKFFTFDDEGNATKFKTSGFAGGVKKQFIEELKAALDIANSPELDALVKKTFKEISDRFSEKDFRKDIVDKAAKVTGTANKLKYDYNQRQSDATQATDIEKRIKDAQSDSGVIGQAAQKNAEGVARLTEEQERQNAAALAAAKGEGAYAGSLSSSLGALESFHSELANVNTEMLRVQGAQRTFNSLKMAVTNFMGFNQILNITKRAINEAAQHIQKLDSIMNSIAVVTDMTTADLWKQVDTYSQMAQAYGVTIEGAYEVSKIYYQQGRG